MNRGQRHVRACCLKSVVNCHRKLDRQDPFAFFKMLGWLQQRLMPQDDHKKGYTNDHESSVHFSA